jgi:hypothetical protein
MTMINGISFPDCEMSVDYGHSIDLPEERKVGRKDDKKDGKVGRRYLHPAFKDAVGLAHDAGAIKYEPFNFLNPGLTILQLLDACERHIDEFRWNGDYDDDCSKRLGRLVHHLGNAGACLNMVFAQLAEGVAIDDRRKK